MIRILSAKKCAHQLRRWFFRKRKTASCHFAFDSVNVNFLRASGLARDKLRKPRMPDVPDFFSLNCVAGVLFSAFGFVVFTYGKRMRYWTPMFCGLALMLLPLFVADIALVVGSTLLGIAAIVFRHT
jgi:hypothetical protein